eukprot:NODE_2464_length_425_cov_61.058511_g2383_i0.p2 GENE.NODE_2464_length_425_cov_61.058511_g2383_i0~~NODE_2464_length_425_cov_61.058511_g2383_i0.p2  ORF type:complete len:58 (+),score=19.73 NODE_2464_length_425_cov_61.058511_g2383_i0:24-176(+)
MGNRRRRTVVPGGSMKTFNLGFRKKPEQWANASKELLAVIGSNQWGDHPV